jgi:hypothetical protein
MEKQVAGGLQVCGGTAPEWAPIELSDHTALAFRPHGPDSSILHIHIYETQASEEENDHRTPPSGPPHPELTPLCSEDAYLLSSESSDGTSPSTFCRFHHKTAEGSAPVLHDSAHSSPAGSREDPGEADLKSLIRPALPPGRDEGQAHSTGPAAPDHDMQEPDVRWPAQTSAVAACAAVPLSGRLIAAKSIDLDALEPLPATSDLDERILPCNTLILELNDGLYVWPPSAHLLRTASGQAPPAALLDNMPSAASASAPTTPPSSAWPSPQVGNRACPFAMPCCGYTWRCDCSAI